MGVVGEKIPVNVHTCHLRLLHNPEFVETLLALALALCTFSFFRSDYELFSKNEGER